MSPKKGWGCERVPVLRLGSGMLRKNSGKWSLPDCQLPLYKAREKVTGDLVALKMVKMEPGEDRTQALLPLPPPPGTLGSPPYSLPAVAFSLLPLLADDDVSTLQKEILILKTCRHANIVAYHGSYLW